MAGETFEHPRMREIMAYQTMREGLESRYLGRWVIISGSQLVGDYGSYHEAADAAKQENLDVLDCFIRQVGVEPPIILSYGR